MPFVVSAAIVVLVFVIYGQVRTHAFIDFDDPMYITKNDHVLHGLTWSGVQWAFTHIHAANWHPLTWISHMIDVQIFGMDAGAHALMNVSIHALNCVLLFLFLRLATGAAWQSAMVAALFAVHPLHVESVAWISERKDTLSAFLFLLCLLAYTVYVRRGSRAAYGASVAALALGLMAKPMLVTTPFVLLLLDYWPFRRLEPATARQRIIEKVPFALCIVPSIIATLFAQREAMPQPAVSRLAGDANAPIAYVRYILKTVWPAKLSVMYPFPSSVDLRLTVICAVLILATLFAAYRVREKLPWVFVGWFWFVGMLVPVIGIVQVGRQAMADRYTYLPHIGLFAAIVWSAWYLAETMPRWRRALPVIAGVVILLLTVVAHAQVRYWQGSIPLFEHALRSTSDNNKVAHVNLGAAFVEIGDYPAAEREYRKAIGFSPAATVYTGLSAALSGQGKADAAAEAARQAVAADPKNADAAAALGSAELARGNMAEAAKALARAMELKHDPSLNALLLVARGQLQEATRAFAAAIRNNPKDPELHNSLAAVFAKLGDVPNALAEYSEALKLNPNLYDAHMNYGALLSRTGHEAEAARHFQEGSRIRPQSPEPHVYLGLLEDHLGNFDAAAREIEKAITADHNLANSFLINAIRVPPSPTVIDEYLAYLRQRKGGQ